jgi:hypothetical protein
MKKHISYNTPAVLTKYSNGEYRVVSNEPVVVGQEITVNGQTKVVAAISEEGFSKGDFTGFEIPKSYRLSFK